MFNQAILLGNLTRDPEVRYIPNGTAVCNFGMATNRKYGDKEEVYFGEITAWGKLGENCSKYLTKGSKVLVVGRLTTESWETDDKVKKSKTRIVASEIKFLTPPKQRTDTEEQTQPDEDSIPF